MQRHAGPLHLDIEDIPNADRRPIEEVPHTIEEVAQISRPAASSNAVEITNKENIRPIEAPKNDETMTKEDVETVAQSADAGIVAVETPKPVKGQNTKTARTVLNPGSLHYDRMVRLPSRRKSADAGTPVHTVRRSSRATMPTIRLNYDRVQCIVCKKRFFADNILAGFYDKHSVCSLTCMFNA